jgi:spermidine synthase/S-adenosylmethionine decarboxylase
LKGFQIVADFHQCACEDALLQQVESLKALCLQACAQAGLTVVTQAFYQFGDNLHPGGATGAVVLAESHLAVHTWPELRAVTLDVYVCNVNHDNGERVKALYETLRLTFQPGQVQSTMLRRGDLKQEGIYSSGISAAQ